MELHEIREWVEDNNEGRLDEHEIQHVAMCLEHVHQWYHTGRPLGDFLTAVVKNDFCDAVFYADDINGKAFRLYALFLHNHMPDDWREKALKKGGKNHG